MPYKAASPGLCCWARSEAEYTKSPVSSEDTASIAALPSSEIPSAEIGAAI